MKRVKPIERVSELSLGKHTSGITCTGERIAIARRTFGFLKECLNCTCIVDVFLRIVNVKTTRQFGRS